MRQEEIHKLLAEATGSTRCLDYDACPLQGGLLVNMDGYSMSSSKPPWASIEDWAWRAVIASASDVAASGGRPLGIIYSIGVPSLEEALEAARGVGEAARWIGAEVLKSDTNRCRCDSWIDVGVIGVSSKPIPRSGARPGDLVVQVGYAGYGLLAKLAMEGTLRVEELSEDLIALLRRPRPPLVVGPSISSCGATASSDNSDGLGYTLRVIAESSGVRMLLEDPLVDPRVLRVLRGLGKEPGDAYNSWEDYNLIVTLPRRRASCLLGSCSRLGIPCRIIGRVEKGEGLVYQGRDLRVKVWEWF
ncbi:MAG: AIR synthase related protein [Desulfurococcales archaeon]|nr:AIR synthase related protein [Desulfurococcales archaeon]MCE4605108.1 AIR synthase related protein [Desulfurococcales archaeon]